MKKEKNNIKLCLLLFTGIIFLFLTPFKLNAVHNSTKPYPSNSFNLKNSNNLKLRAKTNRYGYQDAIYFLNSNNSCPYLELGVSCFFTAGRTITGTCQTPPEQNQLVCVPQR